MNTYKYFKILALTLCAGVAAAAHADTAGITGFTGGSAFPYVGQPGNTVGFEFLADQNITVTALGLYNPSSYTLQNSTSSAALTVNHAVGLWNASGTLLATATVGPSNTLINSFYYAGVSSVALMAGQDYFLGAYFTGADDQYISSTTGITTAPAITYIGGTYVQGDSLADPTIVGYTNNGRFGPNIEFNVTPAAVTPEPGTLWLLGTGVAGILGVRRRFPVR